MKAAESQWRVYKMQKTRLTRSLVFVVSDVSAEQTDNEVVILDFICA